MGPELMIVATAMQAVGAIQAGNAAARQSNAAAAASEYNATVSRNQAASAAIASTSQQIAQNRQARQVAGQQRAAVAQSGLGFTGSNRDVIEQSNTLSELDQLNLAYEGTLKQNGFMAQAELDDFQARVQRSNASSARRAGYLKAATAVGMGAMQYGQMPGTGSKSLIPDSIGSVGGGTGLRMGGGVGINYGGRRFG